MGKKKKNKSKKGKTLKIKKSQPKAPKPSKPKPKPQPKPKPKPKPKPQPKPTKPKSDKPKKPKNKLPKINKDKPTKPKSSKSDKSKGSKKPKNTLPKINKDKPKTKPKKPKSTKPKDSKKPKSSKPKDSKKPKNKLPKINKDKPKTKPKKPKSTKPKSSKSDKSEGSKKPKNKLPKINKGEPKTKPKKPKSNKPKDPKGSEAFNTLGGIYGIKNPKSTKGKPAKSTKGKPTKSTKGKTTKGKTKVDLGPGPWAPDYDGKDFKKSDAFLKGWAKSIYGKTGGGNAWGKPSTKKPKKKDTTKEELEKELDFDEKAIESTDPGPSWEPGKTAAKVRNQWKGRLTDKNTKPNRLKVKYESTGKLRKYTDKKGNFDTNSYVNNFRKKLAQRAQERGLRGDAMKQIRASGAKVRGTTPPKYGGVINDLRKKLGDVDYKSEFKKTSRKLTQSVTSGADKYKQTGLNIIKGQGSEDTALPIAKPRKPKNSTKPPGRNRPKKIKKF